MDYKPKGSPRRPRRANRTTDTTVTYYQDTPQDTVELLFSLKDLILDIEYNKEKLTRTQQAGKVAKLSQLAQGEIRCYIGYLSAFYFSMLLLWT